MGIILEIILFHVYGNLLVLNIALKSFGKIKFEEKHLIAHAKWIPKYS